MVWLRPENSSNVIIPGSSHLIPHEKPRELGTSFRVRHLQLLR